MLTILHNCPAAGTGAACPRSNDGECAAAATEHPGCRVLCARPDESEEEHFRGRSPESASHPLDRAVILVDPPVGPFSPAADVRAWIDYLRTLGEAPEVLEAIAQAERWLANTRQEAE